MQEGEALYILYGISKYIIEFVTITLPAGMLVHLAVTKMSIELAIVYAV
jgi:hypothetical protein